MLNESTKLQSPKDLFDIRLKILRHTNPLRAKILIFSIIYHPFKFSTRDWLTIKMQDLDNLIRHLYSICPTTIVLEEKLHATAQKLNQKEEYLHTANIIIKAMKSLYSTSEINPDCPVYVSEEIPKNPEIDRAERSRSILHEDRIESHDPHPNFDDDETQLLDLDSGNLAWHGEPLESLPSANSQMPRDRELDADDDLTQPLFLDELEEVSETISYDSVQPDSLTSEKPLPNDPNLDDAEDLDHLSFDRESKENSPIFALNSDPDRGNITASLLQKMELDEDVRRLINEQAQKVRESLVEAVQYVEQELDRISIDLAPNERIAIKYPALQQLTDTLSAHLTQIQNILKVQAKSAIAPPPPPFIASPNSQPKTALSTPQALVTLLNPVLKPQGIKTLAKQKDRCLHIVLESTQTLNPQKLITFIQAALVDLKLKEIEQIKVYSRKPGHQSPEWIQLIRVSPP